MVKNFELHGSIDDMITICERWTRLNIIKEIGMITYLFQLHKNIQQLDSIFIPNSLNRINISRNNFLVKLLLQLSKSKEQVNFLFAGKIAFNIHFEPSQHKRFQQPMNLLNHLLLTIGFIFLRIRCEQIIKVICGLKQLWHQKV